MNADRPPSPQQAADQEMEDEDHVLGAGPGPGSISATAARQRGLNESEQPRNRSPTPPRALFRSTTGKGVAFTDDDIAFLVNFMDYRKYVNGVLSFLFISNFRFLCRSQGRLDMVAFWKEVAAKVTTVQILDSTVVLLTLCRHLITPGRLG